MILGRFGPLVEMRQNASTPGVEEEKEIGNTSGLADIVRVCDEVAAMHFNNKDSDRPAVIPHWGRRCSSTAASELVLWESALPSDTLGAVSPPVGSQGVSERPSCSSLVFLADISRAQL